MCPVKWQRQYDLMENSTLVSARTLLLVLENIESNVKLNDKPPSSDKSKGADSKRKMDSIDARIPKKAQEAGQRSTVLSARNMWVHTPHTSPRSADVTHKDGSHKKAGGMPKPNKPESGKDRMNVAQLICTETRKAVRSALKKSNHGRKHSSRNDESDSISDSDY